MRKRQSFRREGKLRETKRTGIPEIFISLDTETHFVKIDNVNVVFPFRLAVATLTLLTKTGQLKSREVFRFTSKQSVCDFILSHLKKRRTLYIIGHNIGFDVRVLNIPQYFHKQGCTSNPPILNERVFIWSGEMNEAKFSFIDTANFGVHSVEQLGKDLGFNKMSIDFEDTNDEELFIYCQRDTEICEKFMLEYINFIYQNNLGEFKVTLASQALCSFRNRFMHTAIYLHCDNEINELEREAYHGGRVECFYIGKLPTQEYYYLDVNSMYPYVMATKEMPREKIGYTKNTSLAYLKDVINRAYCIADVVIETDKMVYPVKTKERLVFPTGKGRTILHNAELIYAIQNNHINEVRRIAVYKKAILFDEYVRFFYDIKTKSTETGNKSWRYISKLFQNSLYGKFGQSFRDSTPIRTCDPDIIFRGPGHSEPNNEDFLEISWEGTVYRELTGGEVAHSFPAIAGAVTAEARMVLIDYIEKAGWENVFYVDTDSLIVNKYGIDNLKDYLSEYELGKLKIEDSSSSCILRGCKDYSFGDKTKIKGVPSKAEEIRENRWRYLQFQGFISAMRDSFPDVVKGFYVEKERSGIYTKAYVADDGMIIPYDFNDLV